MKYIRQACCQRLLAYLQVSHLALTHVFSESLNSGEEVTQPTLPIMSKLSVLRRKSHPAGEDMRPAPDVSLVAPILALRGVPARMPDVTIKVECNGGKGVTAIIRPEHGPADQCFVVFEELKCVLFLFPALAIGLAVRL